VALDAIARRLYQLNVGTLNLASGAEIRETLQQAVAELGGSRFSLLFLAAEWDDVVDAWQLTNWEQYRDVARLGRKTRLPEKQREELWSIFHRVQTELDRRGSITTAGMYGRLAAHFGNTDRLPFDHVIVDEAQDLSIPQLRFLATLAGDRANSLFFTGDLGQRIFQQPFSWKSLGVNIAGRSRTLRVNYRTSHQIRTQSDRLLAPEIIDVDGNTESRRGAVSVFNGPEPVIAVLPSTNEEISQVTSWLKQRFAEGTPPDEIALFVRSRDQIARARAAAAAAGVGVNELDERLQTLPGQVAICTMHLAKGLEFRAVAVMACDEGVIPLDERIASVGDDADLEDVYNTERHLLYVACTRARDHLILTATYPASEFLDDLR
jgi:superfamily I DNA/RNA helicase